MQICKLRGKALFTSNKKVVAFGRKLILSPSVYKITMVRRNDQEPVYFAASKTYCLADCDRLNATFIFALP